MKQLVTIICLVHFCPHLSGQKNYFSMVAGLGPSYFFNDPSLNRRIDRSWLIGVNYILNNKNQVIAFNPGIHLQTNAYHSQVQPGRIIQLKQRAINIHLDMLLRLSKKSYLRAGIFFNSIINHYAEITDKQQNKGYYYSWSNDSVYGNYHEKSFQAGVTLGICFNFLLFKRKNRFGLQLNHFATPLVNSDYRLSKAVAGQNITVLSTKARPTMLLLTLELSLQKREKKKKEEKEE